MKKALLTVFCGIVVVLAAILMWKFLIPFIGVIIGGLFDILSTLLSWLA